MELFAIIGIVWAVWMVVKTVLISIGSRIQQEEIKEKIAERIRVVRLETLDDHNTILAYDAENNQFLGQGQSDDEIKKNIVDRFPERVFILGEQVFSGLGGNLKVMTNASTNAS